MTQFNWGFFVKSVNWHREPDGKVRVSEKGSKGIRWPRGKCFHFDAWSDDQIEAWVQNYNATVPSSRPNGKTIPEKVYSLIVDFEAYQKAKQVLATGTIKCDTRNISKAVEYFCLKTDNLNLWPQFSINLADYLLNERKPKLLPSHTYQIQLSLNKFWKWLRKNKKLVAGELELETVGGHAKRKDTPLQFHLTPDEVLAFVRLASNESIKIMALVGYFASLRPQETFALRLNDFITGKSAKGLEPCKVMASIGLFDGLAIDIDKQRRAIRKEDADPKKDSKGVVALFNKEAAQELVALLRVVKADSRMDLFKFNNKYYYDLWAANGFKGIQLDFRPGS